MRWESRQTCPQQVARCERIVHKSTEPVVHRLRSRSQIAGERGKVRRLGRLAAEGTMRSALVVQAQVRPRRVFASATRS